MEYRIIEREPITLLARVEQFPSEAITAPEKVSYTIPDFWKKSMESGVMQVLEKHAATSDIYGACTPISQEKGTFEFGIGVRHDGSGIPDGYQLWTISSPLWAVFKCIGTDPSSVSETWDKINREFEEQSGYKMLEETDYEFYPEEKEANIFCELWVPVEKQPN
jgi:AraC family transcriptional regulator